jgi:hypothetical protein
MAAAAVVMASRSLDVKSVLRAVAGYGLHSVPDRRPVVWHAVRRRLNLKTRPPSPCVPHPFLVADCCGDTVQSTSWSLSTASFSISSGTLLTRAGTLLDFEFGTRTFSGIIVYARDSASQQTSGTFSVTVTDV